MLFYGQMNPTPDDPASLKRFWSATDGGTKYRVDEQQINAKLVDLTVEHYSTIAVTSNVGLRKITVL